MKKTLKKFLEKHNACEDGFEFAKDLTLEQFLSTCERGDWILWLYTRTNPNDKRTRILVAAHCANTVRHLMRDQRSLDAIDIALKYGNNQATDEELDAAASAAASAAIAAIAAASAASAAYAVSAAASAAANAAANAAIAAYETTNAAANAANAAYAAYVAANAAADAAANVADAVANAAARKANQKLTADICRQYLPIEIWNEI